MRSRTGRAFRPARCRGSSVGEFASGRRASGPASTNRATDGPSPRDPPEIGTAILFALALRGFFLILIIALARELSKEQAAQPTTADRSADEEAGQAMLFLPILLVDIDVVAAIVIRALLTKAAGNNRGAYPPATAHPCPEQETDELTILVAPFLVDLVNVVFVVVAGGLAQVAREKRRACEPASPHPGTEGETDKLMILVLLVLLVVLDFLPTLADEVRDEQSPQAPPPNGAADQESSDIAILVAFLVLDFVGIFTTVVDQPCDHQPAQPISAHHPASSQDAGEILFVSVARSPGPGCCKDHYLLLPAELGG